MSLRPGSSYPIAGQSEWIQWMMVVTLPQIWLSNRQISDQCHIINHYSDSDHI